MSDDSKSTMTRERSLFLDALKLSTPEERAAFLDRECGGDANLRAAIDSLLQHHKEDGFMAKPGGTVRLETVTEKPGDTIGRYKLMEQIGEGGFGVVYVAEQREPVRRRVALKISKLGMDTRQVVARFEAERQALAMMDHPNIAKVLDGGATASGRPYFVMELVKGVKVTEYCDQNKLTTRQRLDLFIQICRAVQHAHQKGVIHRDIKPSNILVTLHDGVPVPKVIDFGIAKATQGHLTDKTIYTEFQQFLGTPAYMSPEQAEMSGLDIDTRSDLYSLGVLLYELLTGGPPFDSKELLAAGLDEMRRTIREKEPPRPSTRLGSLTGNDLTTTARHHGTEALKLMNLVRGDLDWIVMKCLEKERARRYETASGLAADIERHLNNEPIIARPPGNMYRLQKMVRRHRLAFAAGTAVAVSILVGLGVSSWLLATERQARQLAAAAETKAQAEARRADQNAAEEAAQRRRANSALANTDFLLAQRLIADGKKADALAHLSRCLSLNPTNNAALLRLSDLLTYSSWMVPTMTFEHTNMIDSAEFSPDGKQIITYSYTYHIARVWDVLTGRMLREIHGVTFSNVITFGEVSFTNGENITTSSLVVSNSQDNPNPPPVPFRETSPDGKRIVISSVDDTAEIVNAQTGKPLTEPWKHNGAINSAYFSPDGKRIVTISDWRYAVRIWDAQTGMPLMEPWNHWGAVHTVRFSPDGKRIVTVGMNARLWDAQTGQPLIDGLKQAGKVNAANFSPDGMSIVTASEDGSVRVWDTRSGQPLTESMGHADAVSFAAFSPDGKGIVTVSGGAAWIWNALSIPALTEPLDHVPTNNGDFSPDGKKFLVISPQLNTDLVRVLDARTGQSLTDPLQHPKDVIVSSARFSPDGKRIVTTSSDGTARIWDAQTGKLLQPLLIHDGNVNVNYAEFSPDGTQMVTASSGNAVRIWDAQTGEPLTESWVRYFDFANTSTSAHFSPDRKRIAVDWDDPKLGRGRYYEGTNGKDIYIGPVFIPPQVWDVPPSSSPFPDWLLPLTEAISGEHVDEHGFLEATKLNRAETIKQIHERLNRETANDDWTVWGRWLVADPATRTISPFSKMTVPEWIERQFGDCADASLLEVERYAISVGNANLLQRLAKARQNRIYRLTSAFDSCDHVTTTLHSLLAEGTAAQVRSWLRQATEHVTSFPLNDVAWSWATDNDAKIRNGEFAVICADQAVAKTDRKDPAYLDTLAAAYAETGQFDEAVGTQKEAIALLKNEPDKNDYNSRLKLYEAGKPYHQPTNSQ